jgi:hypothetical protein
MEKTFTKKLKISKGTQTALALLLFFAAFNLLSIGDTWKHTLEPLGLHTFFEENFSGLYQKYDYKFTRYTNDPEKYLVFYSWNLALALLVQLTLFIIFFFIPKSRDYLLALFYPKEQNYFQKIFAPALAPAIVFIYILAGPTTPEGLGGFVYFSGYFSFIFNSFFYSVLNVTTIAVANHLVKKQARPNI